MACGNRQIKRDKFTQKSDLLCPQCNHPKSNKAQSKPLLELKNVLVEQGDHYLEVFLHNCPQCHGYWIKKQTLDTMIECAHKYRVCETHPARYRSIEERPYFMCPTPTCQEMLARIRWESINPYEHKNKLPVVESCRFCESIWLDSGELEWLLETKKSDHRLVDYTYSKNEGANQPALKNANDPEGLTRTEQLTEGTLNIKPDLGSILGEDSGDSGDSGGD